MKRNNFNLAAGGVIALGIVLAFALGGCAGTDVVGKFARTSFNAVLGASNDRARFLEETGTWALSSPDGDLVFFSSNFAREAKGEGDAGFSLDAKPFLAAGMDPSRLPSIDGLKYGFEGDRLVMRFELGDDAFSGEAVKSFEETFSEVVRTQRGRIGYHEKLDHYGISLGDGNMFEWAKDMSKNDKDIVWVLNPEPFIALGIDPSKLEGWIFAKVETKDEKGQPVFVDKLLKPYNIK
ncbi:MAG: hypothetical protein AB1407_02495 [Spirochaetota bacterium]